MNTPKPLKVKQIKSGDHTLEIPDDITATDDIVIMRPGKFLTFKHRRKFSIEFDVGTPADSVEDIPGDGGPHQIRMKMKMLAPPSIAAFKYTIKVEGGPVHDPIVIIDPN